jgi:CRISPR/Cas system-associated protein Cas5 (RAMP superfamily)
MNKLKTVKILGVEMVFDEENKLIPQEISKSRLASLYFRSQKSFRHEIKVIIHSLEYEILRNVSEDDKVYNILQMNFHKKTYNKQVCAILFHYLGDISIEEIENKYTQIKQIYRKNIKKYKK